MSFGDFVLPWPLLLAAIIAYFVGSIPFGLVLTHRAGLGDIRHIGSGNIGATNVLRTGRKGLAAVTLLLDTGKGALVVLAARHFGTNAADVAAAFAVIGHIFPPWLGFNGGKGVATTAGVLLALAWPVGLATILTWLLIVFVTRYSSVAALTASVLAPFYAWLLTGHDRHATEVTLLIVVLIILRHGSNIRRLFRGEEQRIGRRGGSHAATPPPRDAATAPNKDSADRLI